jgi:hypothetical protein
MKYIELIEKAGIEVCEGGPFGYLDFGPAWVTLYDCHLSVVTKIEDHTVVMIEWFDETKNELYSWVNPSISNMMREEDVDGVTTKPVETSDEVLNLWSSYKADKYGEEGNFPNIEEGVIEDDEAEVH